MAENVTKKSKGLWIKSLVIILAVILALLGTLYGVWHYITKDITGEKYKPNESTSVHNEVISEVVVPEGAEPTLPPEAEDGIEDEDIEVYPIEDQEPIEAEPQPTEAITVAPSTNLKANILAWKDSGQPARADVTNILLIGMDNNSADMNVNSRADAMVIVSINHNTKTITLASILRDQYCYVERANGSGKFEKLHHACAYGGPSSQIDMIEKYYKIAIDNYMVVNLYSLPKIIDAVGGVDINVTAAEAKQMNKSYKTNIQAGVNHFNGKNAVGYMRIRYNTGGDTARVNRQRTVITQLIKKMQGQSAGTIASLIFEVSGYIRTGYSSNQMLSLATEALSKGWFNYNINQLTLPDSQCSKSFWVGKGWYWKVDFPVAAQKMQLALYGVTNIELDPDRKSWV